MLDSFTEVPGDLPDEELPPPTDEEGEPVTEDDAVVRPIPPDGPYPP
jgi:hypothetical protein